MSRLVVKMSEVLKKKSWEINPVLVRTLDEWLKRSRLDYVTPGAKVLWDMFKKYDFKYFLEVLCRRPGARLEEGDAGRIWKVMQELIRKSPQVY